MNFSLILTRLIWAICVLGWLVVPSRGKATEARAMWVLKDALVSPASVFQMVRVAKETGFNMILVQARYRGDAYYQSELVGLGQLVQQDENPGFDPLKLAVEEGHKAGLQVHTWINLFVLWSSPTPPTNPGHLLHLHPEWSAFSDGRGTSSEGTYLSPELPQVKQHLLNVIEEIVENYDIDGLHLDYVRYPNTYYNYNALARTRFAQEYAIDPLDLAHGAERLNELFGTVGLRDLSEKWLDWRAEQITGLVEAIHHLISMKKPGIALSAAVKPDINIAYRDYGQDWTEWVNQSVVDFVIPMAYSRNTEIVTRQLAQAIKAVGDERLYAGIGTYNKPISETLRQIEIARALGVKGICLFSYNSLEKEPGSLEKLRFSLRSHQIRGKNNDE